MSAWHFIVKHVLAVSRLMASGHLCIRTNAEQKISFFCNLHPKSLHAGMQLVTRESKGQLLVKLLRTDFFQNSYRGVYPGEVESFVLFELVCFFCLLRTP